MPVPCSFAVASQISPVAISIVVFSCCMQAAAFRLGREFTASLRLKLTWCILTRSVPIQLSLITGGVIPTPTSFFWIAALNWKSSTLPRQVLHRCIAVFCWTWRPPAASFQVAVGWLVPRSPSAGFRIVIFVYYHETFVTPEVPNTIVLQSFSKTNADCSCVDLHRSLQQPGPVRLAPPYCRFYRVPFTGPHRSANWAMNVNAHSMKQFVASLHTNMLHRPRKR